MIPARRSGAVPVSARSIVLTCVLSCTSWAVATGPAAAQEGFGLHGGGSIDPDQGYFGLHFISKPLGGNLRLQPAADVGFGNDVILAAFHIDLANWFDLNPRWRIYFGGGPTVNVYRYDTAAGGPGGDSHTYTDTQGGFDALVGFMNEAGLMFEIRVGSSGSANLRFGVGYTFK